MIQEINFGISAIDFSEKFEIGLQQTLNLFKDAKLKYETLDSPGDILIMPSDYTAFFITLENILTQVDDLAMEDIYLEREAMTVSEYWKTMLSVEWKPVLTTR
ncbi:MAG: hypothetical protein GT589_03600 [Peptoclostridium sp.]|uniref:hypothetical protein n=1 Tax=Peptoclostridium sp. TaxID=1904860 RepID=UPI00139CC042|nr:hypothetical protein [Peptoclostridium sp.]MZQ75225.1 hypothetical protein [Peptoclostridium sp.]